MSKLRADLSILGEVGLEYPVVAVTFSESEPAGMRRLEEPAALCAMIKAAQDTGAFYASVDEQGCRPGAYVLGQIPHDPIAESGRIGPALGVFASTDANKRVFAEMTRLPEGTARYVLFTRLDDLRFDPDLLIVMARPTQAEVILRAHGYTTGAAWETRGTTVVGCASLYAYPYVTGKMNILVTGLHHGMRARQLFPEGLLLMSIPAPLIPMIVENLATMAEKGLLDLPQYHWGKEAHEKHMRELVQRLAQEQEPPSQAG